MNKDVLPLVNKKIKQKSNSFLTLDEKQAYLRILMKKGLSFKDAKDRLNNLTSQLNKVRSQMKEKNKTDEEIKIKQNKMIQKLYKF